MSIRPALEFEAVMGSCLVAGLRRAVAECSWVHVKGYYNYYFYYYYYYYYSYYDYNYY